MQPGGGFVETTGPAIPQALPPPHPRRNPSARGCLPGFITVPFITACLDNAVVVPIVRPTGMPRRDPYPLTEHSHGENQTRRLRLWTFPRSRDVEYQTRGRKKGEERQLLSQCSFPEQLCASIGNNLAYYHRERSNSRSRESREVRWD